MKTVWKYQIDGMPLLIPLGAKLLALDNQQETPCMWFLVDSEAPKARRYFDVYGTGHTLPDEPGDHIGTFQLQQGALVFHVFEKALS